MAVDQSSLRMILTLLKMHDAYRFEGNVLTLGVQDIVASHEDAIGILDELQFTYSRIPQAERQFSDAKRYKEFSLVSNVDSIMHMNDLFKMLGFDKIDSLDAFDNENPTVQHDLNYPVPARLHDGFDVIIDFGVTEHVFDIRQSIENTVNMLRLGGTVMLCLPLMGWHNQVFYNFQPAFFFDTFGANGFDEMRLYINYYPKYGQVDPSKRTWREFRYDDEISFTKRFHYTNVLFMARKAKKLKDFAVPTHGYYVRFHGEQTEEGKDSELYAQEPSFLKMVPGFVARYYQRLAPVFRVLPNWARAIILDSVLCRIAHRKEMRERKKFYF